MTNLTKVQEVALRTIAEAPTAIGVMDVTLRALLSKHLIKDLSGGTRMRFELTGQGRTLLGQIDAAPADGPQMPADPFAVFDQYGQEG